MIRLDWNRRLVDIVCNSVGVWAVDDQGYIHFRHGHSSNSSDNSLLNPAWIPIPGEAIYNRSFAQIFCGPKNWMVIDRELFPSKYVVFFRSMQRITSKQCMRESVSMKLTILEHRGKFSKVKDCETS